jgi:exonuclease SbcC
VIPQRVKLKGFLCYKEEQTVEFDGNATLWMLSGLNGSGKSAIFDAVTFAVFGHHRGGGQHNHELINKDCDGLSVEFDFLLDGKPYRAKRTLKRDTKGGARGTQQMFRLQGGHNGDGKGSWVAVEGTGQKRDFDAWVAENIGLTYETFTSSVLLLQGKAEKLLDSKPEGRREVLASIVDLERYERLHKEADDRRKAQEGALKTLAGRLAALPPVAPLEVVAAANRIEDAEAARDKARAEVQRLVGLEHEARAWAGLQGRIGQARDRLGRARQVLADAAAIEQKVARLRELREALPHLNEIVVCRGQAHEADTKTKALTAEREKLLAQLAQRDNALKQARDKRSSLQHLIVQDEAKHRDLAGRLRASAARLDKLNECERREADLGRLREDLARLPADPAADLARARAACNALEALSRTVPVLARFQARRDELRQALAREQSALQSQQTVQERGAARGAEVKRLKPQLEQAAAALEQATEQAAAARTVLEQARESLAELTQLAGAKVCRHCGQALTEGHVKEEKKRRGAELGAAEVKSQQAARAQQAARDAEARLRKELEQAEKAYQEARDEYRDAKAQITHARQDIERLRRDCAQAYEELPEPFRGRIAPAPLADWLATTYPTPDDLAALREEGKGARAAQQQLGKAEQVVQRWGTLRAQEAATLEGVNRLLQELPADRQAVRKEHSNLELEEKGLFKALDAHRAQAGAVEAELDRLGRERERAQADLGALDAQLKQQELVRNNSARGTAQHLKQLPPAWQAQAEKAGIRELSDFKRERDGLEQEGTDARARELEQARLNIDVWQQEVATLEGEQDRYPAEARQGLEAIAKKRDEAQAADRACDEQLAEARKQLAILENTRTQREQVEQEYLAVEGELASHRLLAELLGRDRLQLYLVRQAERQVVEYANAVLDRLSGGQLYLKLSGEANGEGASAKALELEAYNRGTGERPINVAFLSGSQKFRVAVSLALGIGQYASKQHRPIESVIIDEGFGCLDSQGRQVMIQELQNLRSQMRCILLVSHQEDFAESFSDGYHFQLEGGATRVRRFQK